MLATSRLVVGAISSRRASGLSLSKSASSLCNKCITGKLSSSRSFMTTPNLPALPLQISKYPGTRILEMQNEDNGNSITLEASTRIQTHLESFSKNNIVNIVVFSSNCRTIFSATNSNDAEDIKSGHALSNSIKKFGKETITFYNGEVNGTSFGIFQPSKYRLGTTTTKFAITELKINGSIPVGGLAYYLANNLKDGIALARYLGATGAVLNTAALLELGLLTHFVEEDGHHVLADCLAHSMPANTKSMGYQPDEMIALDSLDELLGNMDARDSTNVIDDPIFERYSIIPRAQVEESLSNDPVALKREMETFSNFRAPILEKLDMIDMCFNVKSVDASIKKLESLIPSKSKEASQWATETLDSLNKVNRRTLESWFRLTRDAKSRTLAEVHEAELQEIAELSKKEE
jgi:enoyl-CoA hydratase/carnithine racemase